MTLLLIGNVGAVVVTALASSILVKGVGGIHRRTFASSLLGGIFAGIALIFYLLEAESGLEGSVEAPIMSLNFILLHFYGIFCQRGQEPDEPEAHGEGGIRAPRCHEIK